MKQLLFLVITTAILCSCSNSSGKHATNDASSPKSEKKEMKPGAMATSDDGWNMKAKINGKDYSAYSVWLPEGEHEIVGFYDGDKYIGLHYKPKDLVMGNKLSFSDLHADLTTNDSVGIRSGDMGELEITKVDDKWIEGKFFFTAVSYDAKKSKTIEVTDGFFRVEVDKAKQ